MCHLRELPVTQSLNCFAHDSQSRLGASSQKPKRKYCYTALTCQNYKNVRTSGHERSREHTRHRYRAISLITYKSNRLQRPTFVWNSYCSRLWPLLQRKHSTASPQTALNVRVCPAPPLSQCGFFSAQAHPLLTFPPHTENKKKLKNKNRWCFKERSR
jgi:hypothetical protein